MNHIELQSIPADVEKWPAERIVRWAAERFAGGLVLTCSFGGGGIVLAHMLKKCGFDGPILFLDTGFHFPETLQFRREFAERFDLRVVDVRPEMSVEEQAARLGPRLYARDPDLCCMKRKVEPLANVLLDLEADAWMSALRRDQSPTRRHLRIVEEHVLASSPASGRPARTRRLAKIYPLASWTRQDVQRYIEKHRLPQHPLLGQGYTSIGCAPCTRPPSDPGDERSGRWAGTGKTECGLHTFTAPAPTGEDPPPA